MSSNFSVLATLCKEIPQPLFKFPGTVTRILNIGDPNSFVGFGKILKVPPGHLILLQSSNDIRRVDKWLRKDIPNSFNDLRVLQIICGQPP